MFPSKLKKQFFKIHHHDPRAKEHPTAISCRSNLLGQRGRGGGKRLLVPRHEVERGLVRLLTLEATYTGRCRLERGGLLQSCQHKVRLYLPPQCYQHVVTLLAAAVGPTASRFCKNQHNSVSVRRSSITRIRSLENLRYPGYKVYKVQVIKVELSTNLNFFNFYLCIF